MQNRKFYSNFNHGLSSMFALAEFSYKLQLFYVNNYKTLK